MYFGIDANYGNFVYEWTSEYLFKNFIWISYEMNEWEWDYIWEILGFVDKMEFGIDWKFWKCF